MRRTSPLVAAVLLVATAPAAAQTATEAPRVAFLARGDGYQLQLFTVAPDGSDRQPVSSEAVGYTSPFDGPRRSVPAWRPDGRALLVAVREGEQTDLVEVPLDGGPLRTLVANAEDPAYSPDGTRLAFRSGSGLGTSAPDGGAAQRMEPGVAALGPPFWSPDGERLLFLGAAPGSEPLYGQGALYSVQAGGGGLKRLTPPGLVVTDVEVAEDGRAALVAAEEPDFEVPADAYLYDDAATEPLRRVTGVAAAGGFVRTAALSPAGELAFTVGADSRAREHDVRLTDVVGAPGPGRTVATIETDDPYLIDWSDDGRAMAVSGEVFDSGSHDEWSAYLVDPAGAGARPLAPSWRSEGVEVNGPRGAVFAPSAPLVASTRYLGRDRFETAALLAGEVPPDDVPTVVLARADDYADALAAAPLARAHDAPVLLTGSERLHDDAAEVIAGRERVVLVGSEAALSPRVAEEVRALGVPAVERVAGVDRFDTARLLAERLAAETEGCEHAYLALGRSADPARGWPDAVAAAGLAAAEGAPVLLTDASTLPTTTAEALNGCATASIVGGAAAVTEDVRGAAERVLAGTVDRIAGADRYATSAAVAGRTGAPRTVWLATGENWPDALAAGPAVAARDGVLLLVPGAGPHLPEATVEALRALPPVEEMIVVGDEGVLSTRIAAEARRLLRPAAEDS